MLIPISCQACFVQGVVRCIAEGGQLFGGLKLKLDQGERTNVINLIMNDHEYHIL